MPTKYIPSVAGGPVVPVFTPGHETPRNGGARRPMQNWPYQSMPVVQPERQFNDPGDTGYVDTIGQAVHQKTTVQTIEVQQHVFKLVAPLRVWKRRINHWFTGRADRMPMLNLAAPYKLQSIPGYIVSQTQVTTSKINANQNSGGGKLRAPNINETGNATC